MRTNYRKPKRSSIEWLGFVVLTIAQALNWLAIAAAFVFGLLAGGCAKDMEPLWRIQW